MSSNPQVAAPGKHLSCCQGLFQRSLSDEFGAAIRGDIVKLTLSYVVIIASWLRELIWIQGQWGQCRRRQRCFGFCTHLIAALRQRLLPELLELLSCSPLLRDLETFTRRCKMAFSGLPHIEVDCNCWNCLLTLSCSFMSLCGTCLLATLAPFCRRALGLKRDDPFMGVTSHFGAIYCRVSKPAEVYCAATWPGRSRLFQDPSDSIAGMEECGSSFGTLTLCCTHLSNSCDLR